MFLTPTAADAEQVVALAQLADELGPRSRHVPGPPVPAAVPRHLDAAVLRRRPDRAASASRPTCSTCRCGRRRSSPAPPRAWTSSAADASSSALAPARSGTAIEAMGGRRLSPGEGVDALEEAIDVIRALWDVERPEKARSRRRALPAAGRQPAGPAPAPPHPDLDRRLQAADARSRRPQGGRLARRACRYLSRAPSPPAMRRSTRPPQAPAATRARSAGCSTSGRCRPTSWRGSRWRTASARSSSSATTRPRSRRLAEETAPEVRRQVEKARA